MVATLVAVTGAAQQMTPRHRPVGMTGKAAVVRAVKQATTNDADGRTMAVPVAMTMEVLRKTRRKTKKMTTLCANRYRTLPSP